MATSGTTAFDLNIDEIIDEGYERCGLSTNAGYDLRSARRSLNLLFAEFLSSRKILCLDYQYPCKKTYVAPSRVLFHPYKEKLVYFPCICYQAKLPNLLRL